MSIYVVDASVAIKWYVREVYEAEAIRLRDSGASLHVPEFVDIEMSAIVWKLIGRNNLPIADASLILQDFFKHPSEVRHPTAPIVSAAFDLADQSNRTVYDCLYLALAIQLNGMMVTADDRLVNSLAKTPWASRVLAIQNVP